VLFLLFGSSAAGKTYALDALRGHLAGVAIHDFDEIGVPSGADRSWRHRSNEIWIRRALEYQAQGTDLVLAGQTPLGELLATPSAPLLEAISACLIDCDDATRIERLRARGPQWWADSSGDVSDYLAWAAWMRGHAADPRWMREVIVTDDGLPDMRWSRLTQLERGDPRWRVRVIDTSAVRVDEVAAELAEWIAEERALVVSR
jgi:hypothetical protein